MKLEIEIDDDTAMYINRFLDEMQDKKSEASTHGVLDMAGLARMLLEDVALAVRRPGSWESEKIWSLLISHGYQPRGTDPA